MLKILHCVKPLMIKTNPAIPITICYTSMNLMRNQGNKKNKKEAKYKRWTNLIARANNFHACKKSYNSFSTSNITLKMSQDNIR